MTKFDVSKFVETYFDPELEIPLTTLLKGIPAAKVHDIAAEMRKKGYSLREVEAFEKTYWQANPPKNDEGGARLTSVEKAVNNRVGGSSDPESFFGFNRINQQKEIIEAVGFFGLPKKSKR